MPVSGEVGSRFAAPVADLLADHELKLLESAALALRGDQTRADWEATSLARIALWRTQADRAVPGALAELGVAVRSALLGAQAEGAAVALADLGGVAVSQPPDLRGVLLSQEKLGAQLASVLQQTPKLLEATLREAVRAGVDEVRAGKATRRGASQQVLDKLLAQGITGFRDKAGRNWSLTSYAEMAVRTETQARALAAGEEAIKALGLNLVKVSDSPRECPLCRPFEGKVLSLEPLPSAKAKEGKPPPTEEEVSQGLRDAENVRKGLEADTFDKKGKLNPDKGWTAESRKAYTQYTEMGYTIINAARRGDPAAALKAAFGDADFLAEYVQKGQLLQSTISKNRLDRDITVARGDTRDLSGVQVGNLIEEPGFLSTTSNLDEAKSFASGRDREQVEGWTMIIRAPKGAQAVAGADYQNEIIFQAGSRMRVTAVDRQQRTIYAQMEE